MYGRRDQMDAHKFMMSRLVAAVLRVDPDAPDRPLRRTSVGLLGGLGVAALVVAIIVVVDLLTDLGNSQAWRKPGTLIVDESSGNRYLLDGDVLRPVLNYASARLIIGGEPQVTTVGAADIAGVTKGSPVGILGAPDALPSPSGRALPWLVCARAGTDRPAVSLSVGDVAGVRPAGAGEALLVRADGQLYLAWQGTRLRITGGWVPRALGLDPDEAVPVDSAWLNALPSGPDLGSPPLAGGDPGPEVDGTPTTVGQLVLVPDAVGDTRFVVVPDGLVPVSETVAVLIGADPGGRQPAPLRITPASLVSQQVRPAPVWQTEWPARPPDALDTGSRLPCVRWNGAAATLVSAEPPPGSGQSGDQSAYTRDGRVADRVEVMPGAGLLARTRPAPGVPGAGVYLVTEAGAKFPVAGADAATALGYPVEQAALVPAELLALLPTGPVLGVMK